MSEVRLLVNGRDYRGWTDVRVTRSIEAIAGHFALEVSDRWGGFQADAWPIREGDECSVRIGDLSIITGYVDARRMQYDHESHRFSVTGRDKAGDLVDCSAVLKKYEFANTPLLDLCTTLAAPFGITVTLQDELDDRAVSVTTPSTRRGVATGGAPAGVGSAGASSAMKLLKPTTKTTVNPGDSPFEVIDRLCRLVGVLPVSDGRGGIVLTRTGGARATTDLVEGQNILAGEATYDHAKRYRRYIVAGQSAGSDTLFGTAAAAISAEATDLGVRGARVLLIRPEGVVTTEFARNRAGWEANVRRARAAVFSVRVQGWQQKDGSVWPINAQVTLRSPRLGVDSLMLITEATYSLSASLGSLTVLTLVRPDAFTPEPVLAADTGAGSSALTRVLS